MCGILLTIDFGNNSISEECWKGLADVVCHRGPDYQRCVEFESNKGKLKAKLFSSVLHMRGDHVTRQPFIQDDRVFMFNGEIFDGLEVDSTQNDGQILFEHLIGGKTIEECFGSIEGPYAFVYRDAHKLYYGRDPLGRRSLLVHWPTNERPFFGLTSVSTGGDDKWEEVSCNSLFCIDLASVEDATHCIPHELSPRTLPRVNKSVPPERPPECSLTIEGVLSSQTIPATTLDAFYLVLNEATRRRTQTIPSSYRKDSSSANVAVLFSGGIDCTMVAYLAHQNLPLSEPIDLINVAFENPRVIASQAAALETAAKAQKKRMKKGKGPPGWGKPTGVSAPDALVPGAPPDVDHAATTPETDVEGAADEKVSFDATRPPASGIYSVPDRITGRQSFSMLQRLCPGRQWNFVEVDVAYDETLKYRDHVIQLMAPNRTVMDLSISLAFYFAARGLGRDLTSHARILLSGLGADELLGGYSRHRKAFNQHPDAPWESLTTELQTDLDRLNSRNLGRDDRIISDHGKEARYVFLDADVVKFCCALPVQLKCDMRFPEGVGEKMLLRALAGRLGFDGDVAGLKKRAIHFGARTAKMEPENRNIKGDQLL